MNRKATRILGHVLLVSGFGASLAGAQSNEPATSKAVMADPKPFPAPTKPDASRFPSTIAKPGSGLLPRPGGRWPEPLIPYGVIKPNPVPKVRPTRPILYIPPRILPVRPAPIWEPAADPVKPLPFPVRPRPEAPVTLSSVDGYDR